MRLATLALLLLAGCLVMRLLAGCNTVPAVAVVCLPLTPYSEADQLRLADELDAAPANSMLARAVIDYGRMRDADRACLDPHPPRP